MSNNCTNPPADSLVVGTVIGVDCNNNPIGAGAALATCSDLHEVSDAIGDLDFATHSEVDAVEKKADDAQTAADNAQDAADDAQADATEALNKTVVRVNADGDLREIVLSDNTKIPFYITDTPTPPITYGDVRVQAFDTEGDNLVITTSDGVKHDLTRQEFAEWLASDASPMTTDAELAQAIANGTGNLAAQLAAMQAQLNTINTDQATHFIRDMNLVLRNEDGSESAVPLMDILKVSPDAGNLIELRDNGIYFGIQAPPNLANIYVDGENGVDGSIDEGYGTRQKPFKTLQHALNVTPTDKSNTIHLKATNSAGAVQKFHVTSDYVVENGAQRNFVSYAQPIITDELISCWRSTSPTDVYPEAANEWIRPVIRHDSRRIYNNTQQLLARSQVTKGSIVNYESVGIELPDSDYPESESVVIGRYIHVGSGKIVMRNVDLIDTSNDLTNFAMVYQGTEISISARGVKVISNRNIDANNFAGLITIDGGILALSVTDDSETPASQAQINACGTPVTPRNTSNNFVDLITQSGVVLGIVRHSTGVPLNLTSNVNI